MLKPTLDYIKKTLAQYQVRQQKQFSAAFSTQIADNLHPAAVMIPMLEYQSRWHILLTNRSTSLVEHSGQVAFPGGAREQQDKDLQSTALREMYEEIGVHPDDVDVFGHLGDMPIVTGYLVRPYVGGFPWPYPLEISKDEVESVFIVPLVWLADPAHRTVRTRSYAGREIPVIFFDEYEGHQLWGASAEMMVVLLSALGLLN